MNPSRFFREALESQLFWRSDTFSSESRNEINVVLVPLLDTKLLISLYSCFSFIPELLLHYRT
jgi:hypothetical protein